MLVNVVNAYRITEKLDPSERIETNQGLVSADMWCDMEVKRLMSAGITAKVCTDIRGRVYVVRSRKGCIVARDEDTTTIEVEANNE